MRTDNECTCDREYIFGNEKVNFNDSIILCWQLGMEIAAPTTQAEELALLTAYKKSYPSCNLNRLYIV